MWISLVVLVLTMPLLVVGVRRYPPVTVLRFLAIANVIWLLGIGGMLVASAIASRSRLDRLHEQVGKGQDSSLVSELREASENSLIPPLMFGGGLAFVLAANTATVIYLVRRLKGSVGTGAQPA